MNRLILIVGCLVLLSGLSFGQSNKDKLEKIKTIELRSNSRDITPVRKTNLHKPIDIRKNKAITNAKRQELRQKRAMYQQKRMIQNRKRTQQMLKNQQMRRTKAAIQRGRRR
jgi:hypothetical protein